MSFKKSGVVTPTGKPIEVKDLKKKKKSEKKKK